VAVDVALGEAVTIDVAVAVFVAVAVPVAVAVAVGVVVGVAVGVGFFRFLAEPASKIFCDRLPAVASLMIAILAENVPPRVGANSTVTVHCPCG
jgi:hypothetical protein